MIGILCSNKREGQYAEYFHSQFLPLINKEISIIIFEIAGVDFSNKTVLGSVINGDKIRSARVGVPNVIFNLSTQRKREETKKIRCLREIEGLRMVNEVNQFNQLMIFEILSSSETLRKYLMPSRVYDKKEDNEKINFPELMLINEQPLIIRIHLQKANIQDWDILSLKALQVKDQAAYIGDIGKISKSIVKYINNFIPCLGNCYLDMTIDKEFRPYFLHFGGWDRKLLEKGNKVSKAFCRNMLSFYNDCILDGKGASDNVGKD